MNPVQSIISQIIILLILLTFSYPQTPNSVNVTIHKSSTQPATNSDRDTTWQCNFNVEKNRLVSVGENPFFILKPGFQLVFKGRENQHVIELIITVLNETKMVDGVETRIVEERESKDGHLIEISRNYFAMHPQTGNVYYFGEAVDMYKNGEIISHDGAWESGKNFAHFGLMMAGTPSLNQRHYQEIAPSIAMDRVEVISLCDSLETPAGSFQNCLKVEESTPLELGMKEIKIYAQSIGLVKDGNLLLTKYGYNIESINQGK